MPAQLGHRSLHERRRSARGPLYMLVECRGGGEPLWACDISLGGLRCTGRPVWPGTYLDVSFALPDDRERLDAGAQVVSLERAGADLVMGLRFCRLPDGARLAIYRFLDRRRALWARDLPPMLPIARRLFERLGYVPDSLAAA